jgi:MFS family permease
LFPLVVQDLTHGTGRFNVSLGALTTMWGVGAALSNIIAGWIVVVAGYDAAFISLGVLAATGLALYVVAMPETGPNAPRTGGLTQASGLPRTGETRG